MFLSARVQSVKYKVVYAISYEVEALNKEEAETLAEQKLIDEFGEKFADVVAYHFGTNTEEQ